MSDSDLRALLSAEHASALGAMQSSKLDDERANAMDYYLGRMERDMPAPEGRSRAVSFDVADTIEGLMPSLMEIFTGSDEVVQFDPVGPEDVEAAQQETDYVNHVFMNQNPGFLVLYSFIKDALLSKVGVVKVFWETREQEERETYYDQTDDAYALIVSSPDIEVVEHSEKPDPYQQQLAPPQQDGTQPGAQAAQQPQQPPQQQPMLHDVTVVTKKTYACAKVMPVPPEEFGIERGARSIRDCNYCYHKVIRTQSQLIEQGYNESQVEELSTYRAFTNPEELARDTVDEASFAGEEVNKAARLVEIIEHYVRLDYNGDNKATLYKVTTSGDNGQVLKLDGKPDIQPFDSIPFAAMTPIIMTHRFEGRSIADLVMDIQRIKTALTRGMLDNLYLHNNPRVEVAEQNAGDNTLDDLLTSRPGGVIRTKSAGGLNWQVVPDITGSVYPALQYLDARLEQRTGVSKQSQGIDANALQNQSATAVNQVYTASQARMKLIARIFAETGIRDLFWLLHAVIKKHGEKAQVVRLRNQWVNVDPRNWKTRDDLTINVGLGTGSKADQLAHLMAIISLQKDALLNGLTNLVTVENLYNAAKGVTKLLGHKDTDAFFTDPKTQPPPQPKPDPEMLKAQAQMQLQAAKAQADTMHQNAKMQADAALEQQKFEHEKQLAYLDMGMKQQTHNQALTHAQQTHEINLQQIVAKAAAAQHASETKAAAQ